MRSELKSGYQATDGAAYEVFLGRWTERLADALLSSLEIPPDGALLDVGCGTGSLAFAMAKRWPARQVNGVDIAEPYVAFARARSRRRRGSRRDSFRNSRWRTRRADQA